MISTIDRIRMDKAAVDEGFGIARGDTDEWLAFDSIDAPASLRLKRDGTDYIAATNHTGVATDLATHWSTWQGTAPINFTAFATNDTTALHNLVREMWRLARSLPIEPLREFEAQTRNLPKMTEAESLVVQRIGQNIFRDALLDYWGGACAVLGVTEPRLLRASHIKPWAECDTDAERLDVYNGLLLAAHLDAAFDAFLISFDDAGQIIISDTLSVGDRSALALNAGLRLAKIAPAHLPKLASHRERLLSNQTNKN